MHRLKGCEVEIFGLNDQAIVEDVVWRIPLSFEMLLEPGYSLIAFL